MWPMPEEPTPDEQVLAEIAAQHLGVRSLQPQGSDRLDFHDIHVANIRAALIGAYQAGAASRKPARRGSRTSHEPA
jgi:hypothetical protein